MNQLDVKLHQAPVLNKGFLAMQETEGDGLGHFNTFKMKTESAVKTVMIDDLLYKFIPLQTISCGV